MELLKILSNGVNPYDNHGRPTEFLRILYRQRHCQFGLKESESMMGDGLNLPLLALQVKKDPNAKAYDSIRKLGETLNLEPATKQEAQSYDRKVLNSANNPNEQEIDSILP